MSTSTLLNNVFVFGIHQAYSYYKKRSGPDFKELYLGSCLILFAFYTAVSLLIFSVVSLDFDKTVIVLAVPLFYIARVMRYVLLMEYPKSRNIILIAVNTVLIPIIAIMFFTMNASFESIVFFVVFEKIFSLVFYIIKLRIIPRITKDSLRQLASFMKFGFFPMMGLVLNSINYKIDVLMLKAMTTYASVSIYTTGVNISEQCWAIPDTIRDILLSKLTNGKNESEVCMVLRLSNTLTLFIQAGLLAFGYFVILLLYGADYRESFFILSIAMLGSYGMIYTKMITAYNVVEGKQKKTLLFMFITATVNIIVNTYTIPLWGIYGAAIASVISYNLSGIIFIRYFCHSTNAAFRDMLLIKKSDITTIRKMFKKKSVS